MRKIEVGEYVRTKDGIIGKVFEEDDIGSKGVCIDNSFFDDYAEITDFVYYENILKHSFNIIDLIEVRRLCEWNIGNWKRRYFAIYRNKRNRWKWLSYTNITIWRQY